MVELGIEAGKRSALDYHKTAAERLEALSEEDRQKDDLFKFYDVNVQFRDHQYFLKESLSVTHASVDYPNDPPIPDEKPQTPFKFTNVGQEQLKSNKVVFMNHCSELCCIYIDQNDQPQRICIKAENLD